MNSLDSRRYTMFGRVVSFGRSNAADFDAASPAVTRFTTLEGIVHDLDGAKARQQPGRAILKDTLLDALRVDVLNLVRTGNAIAQDEPAMAGKFSAPETASQAALLTSADSLLIELDKPGVAAKFAVHELAANFVEQLRDKRQAVVTAQHAMANDDCTGVSSTAAIRRLVRAGIKEVNYLDAMMHNKYGTNPEKLRGWLSASMVERPARRQKKAATGAPAEVTAAAKACGTALPKAKPAPTPEAAPAPATAA